VWCAGRAFWRKEEACRCGMLGWYAKRLSHAVERGKPIGGVACPAGLPGWCTGQECIVKGEDNKSLLLLQTTYADDSAA
jgi:hypothetical protein